MSLLSDLQTIAEHCSVPVETGVFSGKAPDTYLVVTPLSDSFELHADNAPGCETQEARLSLFSKGSYTKLKSALVCALLGADFYITDRRYIGFEAETGYHHYAIDVEQAAYAKFECELYAMDPEELTSDSINDLYNEICRDYGFDSWNWQEGDWFTVTHFFTSPYYIMSYVTSNDVAMQLYEMELEERGTGLHTYTDYLSGGQPQFMAFLQEAGLQSPFEVIRLKQVRNTLETGLELTENAGNLPKAG